MSYKQQCKMYHYEIIYNFSNFEIRSKVFKIKGKKKIKSKKAGWHNSLKSLTAIKYLNWHLNPYVALLSFMFY